jgi:hypothetical protein
VNGLVRRKEQSDEAGSGPGVAVALPTGARPLAKAFDTVGRRAMARANSSRRPLSEEDRTITPINDTNILFLSKTLNHLLSSETLRRLLQRTKIPGRRHDNLFNILFFIYFLCQKQILHCRKQVSDA